MLVLAACGSDEETPWVRPDNLPPPFATGTGTANIMLDDEGCLDPEENVTITSDQGISVELYEDTCFEPMNGTIPTGPAIVQAPTRTVGFAWCKAARSTCWWTGRTSPASRAN